MSERTIDVLAKRNDEWFKMAKSFKVSNDDAMELVQGMYLKLNDYVTDVSRIMYNETEVNTFFVYTAISNLFNSGYHQTGRGGGKRVNKIVYLDEIPKRELTEDDCLVDIKDYVSDEAILNKIYINLKQDVNNFVDTWYWYDSKLFKLYYDKGMSMRKIAKETGISLKSVFNSLKTAKTKIREEFQEDYNNYKKSLES